MYLSIYLSVCLSVCLSIYVYVYVHVHVHVDVYVYVYVYTYVNVENLLQHNLVGCDWNCNVQHIWGLRTLLIPWMVRKPSTTRLTSVIFWWAPPVSVQSGPQFSEPPEFRGAPKGGIQDQHVTKIIQKPSISFRWWIFPDISICLFITFPIFMGLNLRCFLHISRNVSCLACGID